MYSFYESARSKKFGRTSSNMYLQFKWDTENYATHRYNVKTAKASVDNSAPLTFTHMFIRPKKLQLELERYSTIQRNNRFLLERLATIHREGAWIDNKNYHDIKSLNTWKRQQDMISLAHNNQIMLARLQDVGARLNRHKLEDEYLMNQKRKANILKYPPNWREIQEHLGRLKKETFKKVFDPKYHRKEYEKSRKKALKRWANERKKLEAEKLAKTPDPDEKQETILKKENGGMGEGQKKTLKKSSRPETGKDEKLKLDQKKQRTKNINGKEEAQKKTESTQRKKPLSATARGSTSKTSAHRKEIGGKPGKARPDFSTGFDFKGDSKSTKHKIGEVDKETGSSENSQDQEVVLKEENEPLNKKYSDIDKADFSTSSDSGKQSESEGGLLSTTSGVEESESEKDTTSQDENQASDSYEDEAEISRVSNGNSESSETPDVSDQNYEL